MNKKFQFKKFVSKLIIAALLLSVVIPKFGFNSIAKNLNSRLNISLSSDFDIVSSTITNAIPKVKAESYTQDNKTRAIEKKEDVDDFNKIGSSSLENTSTEYPQPVNYEQFLDNSKFITIDSNSDLDHYIEYLNNWNAAFGSYFDRQFSSHELVKDPLRQIITQRENDYVYNLTFVANKSIKRSDVEELLSKYDTKFLLGHTYTNKYVLEVCELFFKNRYSTRYQKRNESLYQVIKANFKGSSDEFGELLKRLAYEETKTISGQATTFRGMQENPSRDYFLLEERFLSGESEYRVRFKTEEERDLAIQELKNNNNFYVTQSNKTGLYPIDENSIILDLDPLGTPRTNYDEFVTVRNSLSEYNCEVISTEIQLTTWHGQDLNSALVIKALEGTSYVDIYNHLSEMFSERLLTNDVTLCIATTNTYYQYYCSWNPYKVSFGPEWPLINLDGDYLNWIDREYDKECAVELDELLGKYYVIQSPDGKETIKANGREFINAFFIENIIYKKDVTIRPLSDYSLLRKRIYKLYNKNTGEHLLTSSKSEYITLADVGWKREGVSFSLPYTETPESEPIYRVYNPNAKGGDHHYTKSKKEAEKLVKKGWKFDNKGKPVFYGNGSKEVYRLYNKNNGRHHYTSKKTERNKLVKLGWKDEGVGWSAVE